MQKVDYIGRQTKIIKATFLLLPQEQIPFIVEYRIIYIQYSLLEQD